MKIYILTFLAATFTASVAASDQNAATNSSSSEVVASNSATASSAAPVSSVAPSNNAAAPSAAAPAKEPAKKSTPVPASNKATSNKTSDNKANSNEANSNKTNGNKKKAAAVPANFKQSGLASWYGPRYHGRTTASGEKFDMHALTAAHRTLPFGAKVKITNMKNNQYVIVKINDRGPYSGKRIIDVSHAAAKQLGMLRNGLANVSITIVDK
ncbi:MAG: septal ring lytic transglycosylase RlpA family protein [Enterovibrio sp.]